MGVARSGRGRPQGPMERSGRPLRAQQSRSREGAPRHARGDEEQQTELEPGLYKAQERPGAQPAQPPTLAHPRSYDQPGVSKQEGNHGRRAKRERRSPPEGKTLPLLQEHHETPGKGFRVSVKGRLYFSRKGKVKPPVRHGHCSQQTHSALLQTASTEGKLNPVPQPSTAIQTSEPKLLPLLYMFFKDSNPTQKAPRSSERQENLPPTTPQLRQPRSDGGH